MLNSGDIGFMIIAATYVFLMTPGLAFFYGGLAQRKNVLNTMMMSVAFMGLSSVLWVLCGYSLSFSGDLGGVIGNLKWFAFNGVGAEAGLAEPTSDAKYVAFETIYAPEQMPGQQDRFIGGGLKYPYVEGLRLDEAMHPLTLMTVGVYGKALPPQNGAPVRLIVPWKYGFKGIKSIVSIKLTRERPPTTWNLAAPDEYGFYANVNPHVDHPRWSQATERFIGSGGILDVQRQPTLLFNGYADQVASLYRGLDLRENF